MNTCKLCGTELESKIKKYCTNACQQEYQRREKIREWLEGGNPQGTTIPKPIRLYLLDEAGYACTQCGWSGTNPVSGKTVLTIDHTDGNATNNTRGNLRVLCPNCHAMTPTFGALNKGNGRAWRYA